MRSVSPVAALALVVLVAGCGSVTAPKPDPAGGTAFAAALKRLCLKTSAVVPIDPSASVAAITSAADSDNATVVNFVYGPPFHGPHGNIERHGGLAVLTPTISRTSPFAAPITDAAEMLLDMSKWYSLMVEPTHINSATELRAMVETVAAREAEARRDLKRIGVSSCLI